MRTLDHAAHQTHQTHEGHGGHGDHVAQFRRLFWIMLVLAIPTVAFSAMFAMILGYTVPDFPGARGSRRCSAPSCTSGAAGRS